MVGVEALLRWLDPNGGLIPPGEFIPLAEEMGLIEVIGDWVIEELCRQMQVWRADGIQIDVSFNLSPRQLWQADTGQRRNSHLEATGAVPQQVICAGTDS